MDTRDENLDKACKAHLESFRTSFWDNYYDIVLTVLEEPHTRSKGCTPSLPTNKPR